LSGEACTPDNLWQLPMTIIIDPHYPKKILAFTDRGFEIEISVDEDEEEGITYTAWIGYDYGWAMATHAETTKNQALRKAKRWVDMKLASHG